MGRHRLCAYGDIQATSHIVNSCPLTTFDVGLHRLHSANELDAKKILTAFLWRRPPGYPRTIWMKIIQHDLKSSNLSPNEVNWRGSELSTLETDVYAWRYALLVVHAIREDEGEGDILQTMMLYSGWQVASVIWHHQQQLAVVMAVIVSVLDVYVSLRLQWRWVCFERFVSSWTHWTENVSSIWRSRHVAVSRRSVHS